MWGSLSCEILRAYGQYGTRVVIAAAVGLGVSCLGVTPTSAQEATAEIAPAYQFVPDLFEADIPRGETVRSRQRPELDALGFHLGSFYLFPTLENTLSYNDNVFATDNDTESDFVHLVAPSLAVRSDWNNHALMMEAGGRLGFYFDETDENYKDAYGRVGGRVDVSSSTALFSSAGLERSHEARSDPNQVAGASEPTVFYTYSGRAEGRHRFNRVTVSAAGDVRYLDYEDVDATGGGTIDNDDRDRVEIRPGVRVAYEFSPGYSAFVRGEGAFLRYDQTVDNGGFKRDSQGYDLVGGASLDLTGLLFGDFFAGVRQRYFDDSRFDTITGPVVGSKLTWIPTGLTTVILEIDNQIIESVSANSSGYTSSGLGLSVDHELLRNLILSAGAGFRYDDFEGFSRTDKFFSGTVGADYLLNRYLTLGARYRYQKRDSDLSGNDYSRNLISVSLTGKL